MIETLARRLRTGEITARELTASYLARMEARQPEIGAYITVTGERALALADAADVRFRAGDGSLLCGIPCAVKDNLTVEGVPATAASRMLADFVPPYSSAAWELLETAGGVLLGKANLDEFAMGAGGETSAFGPVRNPHDLTRVAGGSSAGSAAAVADGQAVYALGTDTGGSIRVPAAFCGVVGLKPTYGLVSRRGLIAFASSLDTVGVLTATVRDAAIVLDAIAVLDPGDMTGVPRTDTLADWLLATERGASGLRIGIPRALPPLSVGVQAVYERAIAAVCAAGASLTGIDLPSPTDCYTAYYLISAAEASSNLARYDGVRYGHAGGGDTYTEEMQTARGAFGAEVKRRLLAGTYVLSHEGRDAYYDRACRLRAEVSAALSAQLAACDVILLPTTPDVAHRLGERSDGAVPYRDCDCLCTAASLAGMPAVSVPCGTAEGLPVGMQVIAPKMGERVLFSAAAALEEAMRE